MTSRERVRRSLERDQPDRVPRETWILPIAYHEHGERRVEEFVRRWPNDIGHPAVSSPKFLALQQGDPYEVGRYRDEWGCVFENAQRGVIGQVKRPLLDDWSKLDALRPPVEALDWDIEEVDRQCAASDKFMLAQCCPRPFERMQFLRGSQQLYLDIARNSAELHELMRIVHEFFCREVERWAQTAVDGITFMDDWGAQDRLLIAPARWRALFKPLYADYARIAHDRGKKLFMHSDGHIFDIYEELIEVGVDAINSQLFCMDLPEIGRRFKGRITFWGEIDRQHVLPAEDPAVARAAVGQVVEHLYDPAGGVIAQFELGAGARLENAEAIYKAWVDLTGD
jgi:uroporphyrinogen decarboxylase